MFKSMFSLTPGWIKEVESHGKLAKAIILSDPQAVMKGVNGYQGTDKWLDVQARIEPPNETPYEANLKCKLTQIVFGAMKAGLIVNVKYDPNKKSNVVLVDDQNTLLGYRKKTD